MIDGSIRGLKSRLRHVPGLRKAWHAARKVVGRTPVAVADPPPAPIVESVAESATPSPTVIPQVVASTPPPRRLDRSGGAWVASPSKFRVIYVVRPGVWDAAIMRYRGFNLVEALKLAGVEAEHVDDRNIPSRLEEILAFDLIVLVRRQLSPEISLLLDEAKRLSVPVACDIDDYLFDDAIIPHVEILLRAYPDEEPSAIIDWWRSVLLRSDYYSGSTAYLVEKARELGKVGFHIPNGFNLAQIDLSQRAVEEANRSKTAGVVKLGYFSGTRSHQGDFRQVAPVLVRLMAEFSHVILVVAGDFDLEEFPEFRPFSSRVVERPFVDWRLLPPEIAQVDVNLIPLEVNLFTEGKSNLKYYEAALARVPSVATPSRSFAECIDHEHNGFLAENTEQWYEILKRLILDDRLRERTGEAAYRHSSQEYGPMAVARAAISAYQGMIRHHRHSLEIPPDARSVVVLLSDLGIALRDRSPGLVLAARMLESGASVLVHVPDYLPAEEACRLIASRYPGLNWVVQSGGDFPSCNLLIATDAETFRLAERRNRRAVQTIYAGIDGPSSLRTWIDREPIGGHLHAAENTGVLLVIAPASSWDVASAAISLLQADHPAVSIMPCGSSADRGPWAGIPFLDGPEWEALLAARPVALIMGESDTPQVAFDLMAAGCGVVVSSASPANSPGGEAEQGFVSVVREPVAIARVVDSLLVDRVRLSALRFAAEARCRTLPSARDVAISLLRSPKKAEIVPPRPHFASPGVAR